MSRDLGTRAKNVSQKCLSKEFDMDPILKMFDHLKAKIRKADQDGLRSLTKK